MFKNKVVLITGGSRGIGKATAIKFAENNANVVFIYGKNDVEAEKTLSLLNSINPNKKHYKLKLDLSEEKNLTEIVNFVLKKFGKIDILVNNAGICFKRPFEKVTYDESLKIYKTNVLAPMFLSQKLAPIMYKNKYGKIINVASTSGYTDTCPETIDYNISKAGLVALTRDLARQYAPFVNVNAVAPGWVQTEMSKDLTKEYIEKETQNYFLKRFAKSEEIADAILFLASDNSSYINAQTILLDGGHWF